MRTEADQDAQYDAIVSRFPAGLTYDQFKLVALESADDDDDGRLYPHPVGDFFDRTSWMLKMLVEGLVVHWNDGSGRPPQQQPMRWKITKKGREWLATRSGAHSSTASTEKP